MSFPSLPSPARSPRRSLRPALTPSPARRSPRVAAAAAAAAAAAEAAEAIGARFPASPAAAPVAAAAAEAAAVTEVEVEAAAEAAAEAHSPRTERPVTAHADEEEKACPGAGGSTSSTGSSRTGLVYDERFLLHVPDYQHPEAPVRAARIFDKLREYGLADRCQRVAARLATEDELAGAHTREHVAEVLTSPARFAEVPSPSTEQDKGDDEQEKGQGQDDQSGVGCPSGSDADSAIVCRHFDSDTYYCRDSAAAAALSCGALIELASRVASGSLSNGFAVVRPPGHHSNTRSASGFCLFNNVAVAARAIQARHPGIQRIAIVDWDVHHGNGTQDIFEEDKSVLYLSIHRYQGGTFYPNTGNLTEVGSGAGEGFTVNLPLPSAKLGDAEYTEGFSALLLPILRQFKPHLIFVSAGFDCALGDPLGGMEVTAPAFGHLTRMLMDPHVVEDGRVVLALEGGYNPGAIAEAACACVSALLGDALPELSTAITAGNACPLCQAQARAGADADGDVGELTRKVADVSLSDTSTSTRSDALASAGAGAASCSPAGGSTSSKPNATAKAEDGVVALSSERDVRKAQSRQAEFRKTLRAAVRLHSRYWSDLALADLQNQ